MSESYQVEISGRARKSLRRFPEATQTSLLDALTKLEEDPFHPLLDIKGLRGELKGLFRVRVGSYRITYEVDKEARVVRVRQMLPRGSAYG